MRVEEIRNDDGIPEPYDVILVVVEFGAVVIVRRELVRLKVAVRDRLRVIVVGLVHVRVGHRRGTEQPRCERQCDDGAAKPGAHARL